MVAEDSHLLICILIGFDLLVHRFALQSTFFQLVLESDRGIIGSENLSS